ncbi:AraC family transcriptional regulator [Sphingomonas sp. CBMAI 2297]|uniref:helix-turn-helix domain-containing protein n=1 Tax=Sphingomonas sp. CBMAI 2297 TaxID=2991720 RepID=UPI002453751F|nr:AraC family transcriptional regulator [Sphingomonas sp. CBMAI 2297]MDH4746210.1 AraC family transcriptional regulator [Sphingomonas sp. CBMAI 2297]
MPTTEQAAHLDAGAGLLIRAHYPAFEGEIANGPHLRLGLCTGRGTRLVQHRGGARLEGVWRPGTLAISPPGCVGTVSSGPTAMVGLALLPEAFPSMPAWDLDHLDHLSGRFVDDALIASVMVALGHEAALHGPSGAFFEHGVLLVLRRLAELRGAPVPKVPSHPLCERRYALLLDYVEWRLDGQVTVTAMAAAVGLDPSGFSRALKARTGVAPYAWLTRYRMQKAAELLVAGHSVMQVAIRVGYANPGKFAAAFRRVQGCAPSRFARD